jgi:Protein of unknown function (DUF2637)
VVTGRLRQAWAWLTSAPVVTVATAVLITAITAATSYEHEFELAFRNGQPRWVAALLPFTVDGMILGASVVLLWAAGQGIRRPPWPVTALLVGIAATMGANLLAGWGRDWLGAAVSAWSGLALFLFSEVAMWLARARQKLAAGGDSQPAVNRLVPPPLSLAEALPLARAELVARGERHGEGRLAELFGVTRYQVRSALAERAAFGSLPPPSMNGHEKREDVTA